MMPSNCPYCNSPCANAHGEVDNTGERAWVKCDSCGLQGPMAVCREFPTARAREKAIALWNQFAARVLPRHQHAIGLELMVEHQHSEHVKLLEAGVISGSIHVDALNLPTHAREALREGVALDARLVVELEGED